MSGIEVLSRTQRIIVLPHTSVSIVKMGPAGPAGPKGAIGPTGPKGSDGDLIGANLYVAKDGAPTSIATAIDFTTAPTIDGETIEALAMQIEDEEHISGDKGVLSLAVRHDADTPTVDTDGDYTVLHTDSTGKLKVAAYLDATSLAALETTTVVLDATSLASLETINVSNIAGTEFAEDSAHVDGASGSLSLAVRRDSDTSSVSTDGDYAALLVDALGRLKIKHIKDNQIVNGTVTIASGASVSSTGGDSGTGVIDLTKKSLVGIQMPAVWTAAALTFSASMDGGTTYNDLYDDTLTERSILVVASRTITLDPTKFMGCTHIKLRSGTGGAAVNQGAARTINYTTLAL